MLSSEKANQVLSTAFFLAFLFGLIVSILGTVFMRPMVRARLGKIKGALLRSTARQGICFLPIVYPMSWLWGANGVAAVQAAADILTLF